jgi:hypothetical protein
MLVLSAISQGIQKYDVWFVLDQRNPKIDHHTPHYKTDMNSGVSEVAPGIKQE